MPSAVKLREDYSSEELRALARRSKTVGGNFRLPELTWVRQPAQLGIEACWRARWACCRREREPHGSLAATNAGATARQILRRHKDE